MYFPFLCCIATHSSHQPNSTNSLFSIPCSRLTHSSRFHFHSSALLISRLAIHGCQPKLLICNHNRNSLGFLHCYSLQMTRFAAGSRQVRPCRSQNDGQHHVGHLFAPIHICSCRSATVQGNTSNHDLTNTGKPSRESCIDLATHEPTSTHVAFSISHPASRCLFRTHCSCLVLLLLCNTVLVVACSVQ